MELPQRDHNEYHIHRAQITWKRSPYRVTPHAGSNFELCGSFHEPQKEISRVEPHLENLVDAIHLKRLYK